MRKKASILIVDDNASLCDAVADILELKGYNVTTANDGQAAISKVEESPFDMICLDIKMPVMDGVETYKKIKQLRPETVTMMMTAYAVEDLIQDALNEGAFGVIYKPFDFEQLIDIIEEAQRRKAGALILVVDNDPKTSKMLISRLNDSNYRIGIARDGEEAIEMAGEQVYDIIFIELILPGINGLETYLSLKKINPEAIAIMMTSDPQEMTELVNKAINNGAYTCLYKPIDMDKVVRLIDKITEAKKQKA